MVSEHQWAANKQNAQNSPGPGDTSDTRYNATWHGFRGSRVVIKGESMDEYNRMAATLYEVFQPLGTYEYNLVKRIADRSWELERAIRMKADIQSSADYRDTMQQELITLEGYEASIEKSLYRTRRELTRIQAERGFRYNPVREDKARRNGRMPRIQQEILDEILFTTKPGTYKGPVMEHLYSQGEVALERMMQRARQELLRRNEVNTRETLYKTVEHLADVALACDPNLPKHPVTEFPAINRPSPANQQADPAAGDEATGLQAGSPPGESSPDANA